MELRVVRVTDRFDETCRFFGEILGWPVTREWDGGRIYGYGDVGRVELMDGTSPAVAGVMLAIEDPDVAALHERLVGADIEVTRGIADFSWGHRSFAVREPSGIELVFFQWIDGND